MPGPGGLAPALVFSLVLLGGAGRAAAGDLLECLPAGAPLIVTFRTPLATVDRLNAFTRRLPIDNPTRLNARWLMEEIAGNEGWDPQLPCAFVWTKPEWDIGHAVVCFVPTTNHPRFSKLPVGSRGRVDVQTVAATDKPLCFASRIGPFVVASKDKESLEKYTRKLGEGTLRKALSADQITLYETSDIYVYLSMKPWLPKARMFLAQIGMVMKMASAVNAQGAEVNTAMFDWLIGGCETILKDMHSTELAFRVTDNSFLLTHNHTFKPQGKVAAYIAAQHGESENLWEGLPDRPFLMAYATRISAQQDAQIFGDMVACMTRCESVKQKVSDATFKEWSDVLSTWCNQQIASNLLLTHESPNAWIELYSTYHVQDVPVAFGCLSRFQKMGEEVQELLMPTGGIPGKVTETRIDGVDVKEVLIDLDDLDPAVRQMLGAIYGRRPRIQFAPVGEDRLGYVMTNQKEGIKALFAKNVQRPLSRNEGIRRVSRELPENPHMVIVFNVGTCFRYLPALISSMPVTTGGSLKPLPPDKSGGDPLVAWSLVLKKETVRGDLYLSQEDATTIVTMAKAFAEAAEPAAPTTQPKPPEAPAKPSSRGASRP